MSRTPLIFGGLLLTLAAFAGDARAQFVIGPRNEINDLPAESQKLYRSVEAKLKGSRANYSHSAFATYELFPNSKSLHRGPDEWKRYFKEIIPPTKISGKSLDLNQGKVLVGDVVLLERSPNDPEPRVLIYLAELPFPDEQKLRSFFIYPYSEKSGLELNTFPPRWSSYLLRKYGIIPEDAKGAEAEDTITGQEYKFVSQKTEYGFNRGWLTSPKIGGSVFVPSAWWKKGGTYRVLRPEQAKLIWGQKVSAAFREKVIKMARDLEIPDPDYLMAVMAFETGKTFDPAVKNPKSGATGLIQFMPDLSQEAVGATTAELAMMTAEKQLDYVKKYFMAHKGKLKTLDDVYLAVFYPKAIGMPDNYVLGEKAPADSKKLTFSQKLYAQNAKFDANDDDKIEKHEITNTVRKYYELGKKFAE